MSVARPLAGKRIIVTRPIHQASALSARLARVGAYPIVLPTVSIERIEPNHALQEALDVVSGFDWIIFTSVNGVHIFVEEVGEGRAATLINAARVAAIGPITAQALASYGIRTDVVPKRFVAEQIVEALGEVRECRILLPRAERARRMLSEALRDRGARVTDVALYRSALPCADPVALEQIREGVDAVTFTSSSTVENFLKMIAESHREVLERAVIACIGPITAKTASGLGMRVDVVASRYTTEGLVQALVTYFEDRQRVRAGGRGERRWN